MAVSVSLCVSVYNTKTQPPILGGLAYPLEKYNTFIMTMVEGRIVKIKPRYIWKYLSNISPTSKVIINYADILKTFILKKSHVQGIV